MAEPHGNAGASHLPWLLDRGRDHRCSSDAGFPELTASEAFCLVLRARSPAPLVEALHAAVEAAVALPALRQRLARLEITPMVLPPRATTARIRAEFEAWGPIVRASGFTAEE